MELGLGLVVPATGARADVVVRARDGATLADVCDELLARVLPAGSRGTFSIGGRVLPGDALLGVPPLVEGALLAVDAPTERPPLPGLLELHVASGPDAGAVLALVPGELVIGRGESAGVRLDDDELSREHCRLRIGHDGVTVVDLGSTNGTRIGGRDVGRTPVPLPVGGVLHAGGSRLVLAPPAEDPVPVPPTGDGRLAYNRPPRLRPPRPVVQVVVPKPPEERERSPLPVLAMLAPLVLGVVMWRVLGNATFLLFTLMSPVLILGNVVTERRAGRRRSRRETAVW